MKSGTLFDNVLITDDPEYAKQLVEETWGKHKDVSFFYSLIFFGLRYAIERYDLLNEIVFLQVEKTAFEEAEKKREEEVNFYPENASLKIFLLTKFSYTSIC